MTRCSSLALVLLSWCVFTGAVVAQRQFDVAADGLCDEWPEDMHAAADREYLYFRFPFGELRSLLLKEKPVMIEIDVDGDQTTGLRRSGLGIDFDIRVRPGDSWRDPWCEIRWFGAGSPVPIGFERAEPMVLPSSAAESFEFRIRRDAHPGFMARARAVGRLKLTDARTIREGRNRRSEDVVIPFTLSLPKGGPVEFVSSALPTQREGSVRVMSHNVLWSSPEKTPAPFARMYKAIDPDIYMFQEWGRGPWTADYERRLEEWFAEHVDDTRSWTAVRSKAWGVAIVTHHPVLSRGPMELLADSLTSWDYPIRFAAAAVQTPGVAVTIGSVHLKAGGSLGSPEDQRRFDEAREIRATMMAMSQNLARTHPGTKSITVLGGDFNHNGHPKVPASALRGLDADGSALTFAYTPVLGTDSRYSFGGPAYGHRRIFLDYIGIPDSAASITNAFILDTEILDDSSLRSMGLQRSDSSAADHLPVVVDLALTD